jgi:hypothetical protein
MAAVGSPTVDSAGGAGAGPVGDKGLAGDGDVTSTGKALGYVTHTPIMPIRILPTHTLPHRIPIPMDGNRNSVTVN